jgi:hypothetical protein
MNTIIVNLLLAALKNEKVQQAVGDFIGKIVTQKLLPLLPLAAAAAAKAVADQIPQLAGVADVAQVADEVRDRLNEAIPDVDFGIPALDGLLDCPHYTRPEEWAGLRVPDVLLSGHHGEIERWRRGQRLQLTAQQRPDLLDVARKAGLLSRQDELVLQALG